jgi:hypothetical protein
MATDRMLLREGSQYYDFSGKSDIFDSARQDSPTATYREYLQAPGFA